MSATSPDRNDARGAPIARGSPLARALDSYAVPALSDDFADRVLAAAATRAAPLPELRRPSAAPGAGRHRWRLGRRLAMAVVGFGALASAAAATGLLERFDLPVPSAETVWASLTGTDSPARAAPVKPPAIAAVAADPAPAALAPIKIEGPIDTPEELGEAFRRIDQVRAGRSETRRAFIDQRIVTEKARRETAGLPLPTAEQEAKLRERIDQAELRRQEEIDARLKLRREEFARKVDSGEAVTREDVLGTLREERRLLLEREQSRRLRGQGAGPGLGGPGARSLPLGRRRALIESRRGAAGPATSDGPSPRFPTLPADPVLPAQDAPLLPSPELDAAPAASESPAATPEAPQP